MSKIIFLTFLSVLISTCFGINCPTGTVASFDNNYCWLLVNVAQDFISAEKYCQNQGGHLVSIHNGFDNMYLADKARKAFPSTETFAVGGNNLKDMNNWTWIDGTAFDFSDWGNYEPANANTQNCLHIDISQGFWHTKNCYATAPFVCSITGGSQPTNPTFPTSVTNVPGKTTPGINLPTPAIGNNPEYQKASDYFSSVINTKVNPCQDFYNYTCGVYNQPMTFDSTQMTIYQDFYNAYSKGPNSNDPLPVKLIHKQYSECVKARSNWGSLVNDGSIINNLISGYQTTTGFGFPIMDNTNDDWPSAKALGTTLGYMSGVLQVDTLISQFVDTNWINNQDPVNPYLLYIDQSLLSLSWDYYIGKTWDITKPSLYNYVKESFQTYASINNIQLDQTQLDSDINAILNFEYLLANNYSTDALTRWKMMRSYNLYNQQNFTSKYNFIDLKSYFTALSTNANKNVLQKLTSDDYVFDLMEPDRLSDLNQAFSSSFNNLVTPRTLYNYFNYRILLANSDYFPISSRMQKSHFDRTLIEYFDYKKPKVGRPKFTESKFRRLHKLADFKTKDLDDVSMACIDDTLNYFTDASSRIFVDQVYPTQQDKTNIRTSVTKLADQIMNGMQSMLDGLNWMTPATKQSAYSKISKLTKNVAYSDSWIDDGMLTQEYAELTDFSNESNYYNILTALVNFMGKSSLETLLSTKGTSRHDFNGPTGIVNAWYQPEENSITFPGGILRMPFFDPNWPKSIIFGSMGMVAGHELSHGFDSSGTQYDGQGNLHTWMDNQTQTAFDKMTSCVINEYSGFCPLDPNKYSPNCINGQQTVGENVADNAGIRSSFRAYKNAVDYEGEDPRLPGALMSQFNHDQLFFLAFSRLWCQGNVDPAREYVQILVDPHSPSKYRVFGTLQNDPAFRNAFNCPVNDAYTPADHCNVWVSNIN